MISQASSEQSICFVVPEPDAAHVVAALESAFAGEIHRRLIDRVTLEPEVVIVAVVGEGMRGTPGIAAKLFGALGERQLNVIAVAQGSSEANISLVLAAADADAAVRYMHSALAWRGETGLTRGHGDTETRRHGDSRKPQCSLCLGGSISSCAPTAFGLQPAPRRAPAA